MATTAEKEARIIARLLTTPHASLVARKKVLALRLWRLAERECIDLTVGPAAKGYKRLPPEQRRTSRASEARRKHIPTAERETYLPGVYGFFVPPWQALLERLVDSLRMSGN